MNQVYNSFFRNFSRVEGNATAVSNLKTQSNKIYLIHYLPYTAKIESPQGRNKKKKKKKTPLTCDVILYNKLKRYSHKIKIK